MTMRRHHTRASGWRHKQPGWSVAARAVMTLAGISPFLVEPRQRAQAGVVPISWLILFMMQPG
jgi:hypothetical protein